MSETATSATALARLCALCLFFNTGRRADLAVAVAEVTITDTALSLIGQGRSHFAEGTFVEKLVHSQHADSYQA